MERIQRRTDKHLWGHEGRSLGYGSEERSNSLLKPFTDFYSWRGCKESCGVGGVCTEGIGTKKQKPFLSSKEGQGSQLFPRIETLIGCSQVEICLSLRDVALQAVESRVDADEEQ